MNKILITMGLLITSVGFSTAHADAVDMKSAPVCVFEQLKEVTGDVGPYFVMSCGSEIVLTHSVPSYSLIKDKEVYKTFMQKALVAMMGGDSGISCNQTDSEIALVIICSR